MVPHPHTRRLGLQPSSGEGQALLFFLILETLTFSIKHGKPRPLKVWGEGGY